MAIQAFKPTSAGARFYTVSDFAEITTDEPEKKPARAQAVAPAAATTTAASPAASAAVVTSSATA